MSASARTPRALTFALTFSVTAYLARYKILPRERLLNKRLARLCSFRSNVAFHRKHVTALVVALR